ncbi:hypothetical protein PQR71_40225 [Paraburkholderia fungorum]|uniref:hypothetical protein n=1 Tax=Paraburkholderia fungorum TaxID=134537 RepID=UPI0038BDE838
MAQGTPNFAITPFVGVGQVSTASASRTAPTNTATVLTASASGDRIERIVVTSTGSTIAAVISLYLYNGTTYYLYDEIQVNTFTASTTTPQPVSTLEAVTTPHLMPLLLPPSWSIVATVSVSQPSAINVAAIGGGF